MKTLVRADRERKLQRVEARVTPEMKELFQRAADLRGVSFSDFMVTSLREAALATLREEEIIRLERADAEVFADALQNPPPPARALKAAVRKYNRDFG